MEICQSCSKKIESWERVSFGVIGGVTRSWVLCESCADVLRDMVLGYMGEIPPEQGSPESLGEYGIFADGTFVDGDGRFITAPPEEPNCATCRGYSPLLFECTKRTQPGAESCRRHGFAWWEPKELGKNQEETPKEPEPNGTGWAGEETTGVVVNLDVHPTAGEDYTAWYNASPYRDNRVSGVRGPDRKESEVPNNGTIVKMGTVTKNASGGWDIEGWDIDMTDANTGVAAIHVDQDDIVRICGKTIDELQEMEELPFAEEPKKPDRATAEVQELIEKMYHWGIVL